MVGAIYIISLSAMILAVSGPKDSNSAFVVLDSIPFMIIAVVMMFYPLSGFNYGRCLFWTLPHHHDKPTLYLPFINTGIYVFYI